MCKRIYPHVFRSRKYLSVWLPAAAAATAVVRGSRKVIFRRRRSLFRGLQLYSAETHNLKRKTQPQKFHIYSFAARIHFTRFGPPPRENGSRFIGCQQNPQTYTMYRAGTRKPPPLLDKLKECFPIIFIFTFTGRRPDSLELS